MEVQGFDIDWSDLHELQDEEKEEVKKHINALCDEAANMEEKARNLNNGAVSNLIRGHAKKLTEKANDMKAKICIATGKSCKRPNELQAAIIRSQSEYEEQLTVMRRLNSNCRSIGLKFRGETPGNGNCFFEAISSQLGRLCLDHVSPGQLRKRTVDFMLSHPRFETDQGMVNLEDFTQESTFEQYCQKMSTSGEYADHVTVIGMARMLKRDILIVTSSPNSSLEESILWVTGCDRFSGQPILLGHVFENHYQSLEPIGDSCAASATGMQNPSDGQLILEDSNKMSDEYKPDDNIFNRTSTQRNEEGTVPQDFIIKDQPFVNLIKTQFMKKPRNDIECVVHRIREDIDEEDVITHYLINLDVTSNGRFCMRHALKNTIQFNCERSGKPSGRNKGKGPLQTRANRCGAYVSFQFVRHLKKKAVIFRQNLHHSGHDLNNQKEKHKSRPDPSLLDQVNFLLSQDKKPMEIICSIWKWARNQGKFDVNDRRYYLTPKDVKYFTYSYRARKRLHENDAIAVHELCTNVMKNEIVFYQELIDGKQPLLIVYQNASQIERMRSLAQNVVFLDATYKGLTAYGYTFYALVTRSSNNMGTPLAFCISSDDTSDVVKIFLESLKRNAKINGFAFGPRSFMIDRDSKEISAISEVFPNCSILLCWFHVLQAIYRYLNKKESGISGTNDVNVEKRKKVVQYIRTMKHCTEEKDFKEKVKHLEKEMPTKEVTQYLQNNWCNEKWGKFWSNYGRHFFHEDHETNNLVERFFLGIKYHFLGGYSNHRVEDLLLLLNGNITNFYDYIDQLAKNGRLTNLRAFNDEKGKKAAENMLMAGKDKSIVWITPTECNVPSQTTTDKFYDVNIVNVFCNCPAATNGGMCKHIHLSMLVASARNVDLQKERNDQASTIISREQFHHDKDNMQLEVISLSGLPSLVQLESNICSCFASSHGIHCVCVLVAEKLFPPSNYNDVEINSDECAFRLEDTLEEKIQKKVQDIQSFISCDKLKSLSEKKKRSILQSLNEVYIKVCTSNFSKVSRKRKQFPLHPNRTNKKTKVEHSYTTTRKESCKKVNVKTNEDGSFKITGRKKGTLRKTFQ